MFDKEYILCAAVKRKERKKVEGNGPYRIGMNDILDIELGYRHHDIFQRFFGEVSISPKDQGFYTSKGRFVNREEGFKIALEANQLNHKRKYDIEILCSEDLY